MGDRNYHAPLSQGTEHVTYAFTVAGNATATLAPTFVEGDIYSAPGYAAGSYVICSKIGTGKYRFTTTNPFLGVVAFQMNRGMATPTGNAYQEYTKPVQLTTPTAITSIVNGVAATAIAPVNAWQVDVWCYVNSGGTFTLTDLASGDHLSVLWVLRNSSTRP